MKLAINNSDSIGALASTLCLVHCLATPFIFVVQSCAASCCASAPAWWICFDYFFFDYFFFRNLQIYKNNTIKFHKIFIMEFLVSIILLNCQ